MLTKELVEHWLEVLQTSNWEEHMKECGPFQRRLGLERSLRYWNENDSLLFYIKFLHNLSTKDYIEYMDNQHNAGRFEYRGVK